jgi:ABC-type transport system involved in multi-copper enzyme maturation permease subunit
MSDVSIKAIPWLAGLSWLTGPLLDKELRVSSRRRRFYVVRSVYVFLLMATVCFVWFSTVLVTKATSASPVVLASRMSEAAKQIVMTIIWVQFIAGQLFAAVLLSGAISSEIRQRSLDVLLATPISSFQIVVGKFLSKLLQLVSLLVIGLPPLAIVRVFGGVPWDYVVSGLCITLTAALFVGSLSLLLSITDRQMQQVAITALGWCVIMWLGVGSALSALDYAGYISSAQANTISQLTIPPVLMAQHTQAMLTGRGAPLWPWHCSTMLAGTAAMLALSVWRMRKANIFRIVARTQGHSSRKARRQKGQDGPVGRWPWRRKIRPVTGPPIVWKELQRPLFPRGRRGLWSRIFLLLAIGVIVASLLIVLFIGQAPLSSVAIGVAYLLMFVFTINTTSTSASAITREKESRTWPILLTTPLDNGEIVRGKAIGSVRRNLPLIVPVPVLGVLALLFAPSDSFGPGNAGIPGEVIVFFFSWLLRAAGSLVFLVGVAIYMATCVKTTTAALAATFGIYIGSRMVLSMGSTMLLFVGTAAFARPGAGPFGIMLIAAIVQAVVYVLVGLAALVGATRRLRRNVFA